MAYKDILKNETRALQHMPPGYSSGLAQWKSYVKRNLIYLDHPEYIHPMTNEPTIGIWTKSDKKDTKGKGSLIEYNNCAPLAPVEEWYNIFIAAHSEYHHGRDKTFDAIQHKTCSIKKAWVDLFLKACTECEDQIEKSNLAAMKAEPARKRTRERHKTDGTSKAPRNQGRKERTQMEVPNESPTAAGTFSCRGKPSRLISGTNSW